MSDEAGVLAAFDALFAAACEQRDPDAFVSLFVPDADLNWWGSGASEQFAGPTKLRDFAERITRLDGSLRFRWHDRRVRVESDVAWVAALGAYELESDGSSTGGPYRVTAVLLRRGGAWLWHTFHGSEPVGD